ncbi:glyoxalase superfamily protein [Paludisphaera borealis]|uniref:Bleomycin resistance protein n=1 Tax=Paludisphaera borealis TaxID=1387353 RepID=A0A1U7CME7_9BACT|nr:glyoxalase superfamily protein [Paludisphaera borealis]APW60053.1 hypothetical protein BSF38_01515 [Paludisphaera borealis]
MSDFHFEAVPILRIFDIEKAKEFYVGFLGFKVEWEHRYEPTMPVYMQITRDGLTLHLSEHHGDCCPGSTVYVRAKGLDAYHAEITSKGYPYMRPGVEETPWNTRELMVIDPFGNRLRFGEPKSAETKPA